MKRLIIADAKSYSYNGKSIGHYFSVAQNYLELYSEVIITKVAGGPLYFSHFNNSEVFALPYNSISGESQLKNKWKTLMNCKYLFRNSTPQDIIVLQHSGASTTFLGIALFAKKNMNNIFVIQYDTDSISNPIKKFIYKLAQNKIKGFICPNELIGKSYKRPYCIVTDYIYNQTERQIKFQSLIEKKYDFSIVGSIAPDKGVIEMAEYLSKSKYKTIIAGKANEELADKLTSIAQNSSNIELHLGFIDINDYNKYIKESRYCILNYRGVYSNRSSGVALDILFNGIPIIGHKCNALEFIEEENLGFLFNDIKDFNIQSIMDEQIYRKIQKNLLLYLEKQKSYKNTVIKFLNITQNNVC